MITWILNHLLGLGCVHDRELVLAKKPRTCTGPIEVIGKEPVKLSVAYVGNPEFMGPKEISHLIV